MRISIYRLFSYRIIVNTTIQKYSHNANILFTTYSTNVYYLNRRYQNGISR
nr:MAG TPA: hypothetical protein [Bacteriophage sp.]